MRNILTFLCLTGILYAAQAQVIYYTNFNAWKDGWEPILPDTTKQNISRDSAIKSDFPTSPPPASGGFSIQFNLGPNNDTVALLSPLISTIGRTDITVGFGAWKDNWNVQQSPLRFSYSVDEGITWIPIDSQVDTNLVNETWEFLQYDLGPAANNKPGIRFRFRYATSGNSENKIFRIDDFIVGINFNLPIELARFEAVPVSGKRRVDLRWTTASEQDNAWFEVERSSDGGTRYEVIGTVPGAGTTAEARHYTFEDRNAPCGTPIYRLRQVDTNGVYSYSPARAAGLTCSGFRVQPTIASDVLHIAWGEDIPQTQAYWRILGLTGQVLREGELNTDFAGKQDVALDGLREGFYYLQIRSERGEETFPFNKM